MDVLEHFLRHDLLPAQGSSPRTAAPLPTQSYDICEISKLLFSAYKQVCGESVIFLCKGCAVAGYMLIGE